MVNVHTRIVLPDVFNFLRHRHREHKIPDVLSKCELDEIFLWYYLVQMQ